MKMKKTGMSDVWEMNKLGEICDFKGGSQPPKSQFLYEFKKGYVRFLQIRDFASDKYITYIPESPKNRYCRRDDILLGRYGASVGKVLTNKEGAYNVAVIKSIPNKKIILKEYLFYYFNSDYFQANLANVASRSAQNGFSKKDIHNFSILTPPLPEQQRIVSILDHCFEAIDKAKANAEQNLQNAKELFESYLDSVDADKTPLGRLVEIKTGRLNANQAVEDGEYPFFTCSREVFAIDHYAFDTEAILLAGNNASGDFNVKHYSGKFNAYQRTYVITIKSTTEVSYRYLYFQLLKSLKVFKKMSIGANTRFLKIGMIRELMITLPSIKKQHEVVNTLNILMEQSQNLQLHYQKRIDDLEELKKSILQKAFAGELKTEKMVEEMEEVEL